MTPRTIPWTAHSASLDAYHRRYGGHPVGDGEYVYRYDGTETVQTTVPSARWHPGDTFRVLDRIDQPGWTRVDEEGNAIDRYLRGDSKNAKQGRRENAPEDGKDERHRHTEQE